MIRFGIVTFLALFLSACTADKTEEPKSDMDVARAFIRAVMDNKFEEAERYILSDTLNQQYFERFRSFTQKLPAEELDKRRGGDIIVNETSYVTDSVFILNYTPSFNRTEKTKIKLVRINDRWQVDLKYTFSGNL